MFATITPTRGDRPQFLSFCKHQLARMNTKPDKSYFIDYTPKEPFGVIDLVARVKEGVRQAQEDGFDRVYIIEDDDYYQEDYFDDWFPPNVSFIGSNRTTYYHLGNKTYQEWTHDKHSSLFMTAFNISALAKFEWPMDNERFLDISLWKFSYGKNTRWVEPKAIGIKHGIGLCGGKGHVQRNKFSDQNSEWLKSHVDDEAYAFYQSLNLPKR